MKLYELRELLENALEQVEDCIDQYESDEIEVRLEPNTYFIGYGNFLGICGSNGGYLNLTNIEDALKIKDEDEDDEEN